MPKINIELVETAGPPLFRLSSPAGPLARLLEIRVTQVGSDEPSWRVVHEAAMLDDLVQAGIISQAEAEKADVAELRFHDESLLVQTAIPVSEFKYGEVPVGMHEVSEAKTLAPGTLYEVQVSGDGLGDLEFYA